MRDASSPDLLVCREIARASLPRKGNSHGIYSVFGGLPAQIDGGLPLFAQDVSDLILLLSENGQRCK